MNRAVQNLIVFLFVFLHSAWLFAIPATAADAESTFATHVLPLLKSRCFACHGDEPNKIKGGLDLRSAEKLKTGGDSGLPAVLPGKAKESPLYKSVTRHDADFSAMPPKENDKLSAEEIAAFRDWIDGGAPWPSDQRIAELVKASKPSGIMVKTSGGLSPEWTHRTYKAEDLWAFQPISQPSVAGTIHPVDAIIDADLRQRGLKPAPLADRRTLIRRVTFDLTGLPPTPKEVEAFLADPSSDENSFAKVVDRLLSSPHYGEQMAQHWLDVARYADSSGIANDYERGNAWRYRDYVIRSFIKDKPFNQFVKEQIAGDELNADNPEMLIAVGFLRMGAWELTGMEVPRIARQRFLDDVTDSVGQVFLGHMLQCARCHDHKFDPVPTRDYYAMQAIFATTQLVERPAPFLETENTAGFAEKIYLDLRRDTLDSELKRIQQKETAARERWQQTNPGKKGLKPPRHEFLSPADLGLERIARKGLERLKWEYDRYEPFALSVYNGHTPQVKAVLAPTRMPKNPEAGDLDSTHILTGGDPFSPGAPVRPGVLSAVGSFEIPEGLSGRRIALAEWLTDSRNPLTARVMANRIWQWTMGTPLAGNPNNFGATGKKPNHPKLLDWLASEFVKQNWSVKQLQRIILLSQAYRRSSHHPDPGSLAEKDPTGISYVVHKPRRLTAEEIRDAMLATSGELNRTLGGIPVRPEIHPEVAMQPRQVMGTFAPAWEPSPRPEQRHRRTLYTLKLRGSPDPMLETFNAPSPDGSCEAREVSTVAPQAATLMNGEAALMRSLAFATRLLQETKASEATVSLAFEYAFSRKPTQQERALCLKHWESMTKRHHGIHYEKPQRPTSVLREAVEENTGEKFQFREQLVSIKDFVPDLHPGDASPDVRGLMELCLVLFNTNEFIYVD